MDFLDNELTARFSDDNVKIWVAMESLLLSSQNYLNAESVRPLLEYAQSIPAIKAAVGESLTFNQSCCEIQVFKEHLGIVECLQCMEKIVAKVKRFPAAKCIEHFIKLL